MLDIQNFNQIVQQMEEMGHDRSTIFVLLREMYPDTAFLTVWKTRHELEAMGYDLTLIPLNPNCPKISDKVGDIFKGMWKDTCLRDERIGKRILWDLHKLKAEKLLKMKGDE